MVNEIRAQITLKLTENGGRQSPIAREFYPCRVLIGESFHDARIYWEKIDLLSPGDEKEVTVKFLDPEIVLPKLQIGDTFSIWELQKVGQLKILEIS